jgi:hypothetical protein
MTSTTRGHRSAFLLAVPGLLLTAGALAGCGSNAPDVGSQAGVGGTGTASASPTAPDDLVPSRPPTTADGVVNLQGTVALGVEAGCYVLTNATGTYSLLGGRISPAQVGQDVVVTGTVVGKDSSTAGSTCQQGTLLQVTDVLTR